MHKKTFPGFEHPASLLSAYAFCIDVFVLSLTDKRIIRFYPNDPEAFRKWLDDNGVRDITKETGTLVINYYHNLKDEKASLHKTIWTKRANKKRNQ